MTELTLPNVQLLLDRPKGEGMIVSCYVDTSFPRGRARVAIARSWTDSRG